MPKPLPPKKPQTLSITNFSGRLTRLLNGDINSGFSKFTSSWGYDPFSKPLNLTWLEQPTNITGPIDDLVMAMKPRASGSDQDIYAVGTGKKIYKIRSSASGNAQVDSVVAIGSVAANNPSFSTGASIDFFGNTEKIYVGSDGQINSINFDFGGDAVVGNASFYVSNSFRPLKQFIGELIFGNGNTVAAIDATGTIVSSVIGMAGSNRYSELNPGLPADQRVTDIDASIDGNYLLITSSGTANEVLTDATGDRVAAAASSGASFRWNGTDGTVTGFNSIPSYAVTALQVYLQHNLFFANDAFGASINDGVNKIISLPKNKAPFANSTLVNGNFVCWISPEISSDGTKMFASLYYFGALDEENPRGLYRVMRLETDLSNGFVHQTPAHILTNNFYQSTNTAITSIISIGLGKHYFSTYSINPSNTTPNTSTSRLYKFLITPSNSGTPQLGVYETQTQLFSKRISVSQVRVYTEPTATGNGFQLDFVGSDGAVIENGTFNYSFVAGSDPTQMQGALERINFNPNMKTLYAMGIRVTNTGSTNMTIKKIEIDYGEEGK